MSNVISIKHNGARAILQDSGTASKTVLLFIPGASGEALTDRYEPLAEKALQRGLSIMRMQSWKQADDLERKNIQQIHDDIKTAIEYLKKNGYESVIGIGKSFGGTMLLTLRHPMIRRLILWAPVIGVVDEGGNFENKMTILFSQIDSFFDVTIDKKFLLSIDFPVRIILGTADDTAILENSKKLTEMLPDARLAIIKGMGHSYKTANQRKRVIEATLNFTEK